MLTVGIRVEVGVAAAVGWWGRVGWGEVILKEMGRMGRVLTMAMSVRQVVTCEA